MTHAKLVALLKNRLLIEDLVTTHPEILQQELWPVVVVMGLQRTGTTVLHRLLGGSDPKKLRQVISWEAVSPVPLAGYEDKTVQEEQQARIDIAKGQVNALAYLAPHFFAIHTCDALEPEEDVMLLDVALASQVPEATWWVPTYSKWVETLDNTVPYEYLRKCLLILQWQTQQTNPDNEFQRWVLKTPAHLENTDAITTVFPDAKMIHTHREPAKCMISFASMVAHTYGVFSDVVDAPVLAKHWLQKNVKMVTSARAVRAADPDSKSRYLDIAYEDTRTDPIGTVKKIYAFLGLEFTAEHAANVAKIGESHTQGMYGKHVYKSSDFNLTATQVNDLLQ
jgi:hypothetical protein